MDKIKEFEWSTSSAFTGRNLQVSSLVTSILLAMHIVLPTNTEEDVVYAPAPQESIESVERVYYEEPEEEEEKEAEAINLNFSEQ